MRHSRRNSLFPTLSKTKEGDAWKMPVTQNNRRKIGLPRPRARFLLGSMVLVGLVIASTAFALTHFNAGNAPPDTKHSFNESGIIKTTPVSQVTPALKPSTTSKSKTEPKSYSSFRFTAGGDYGHTNNTTATLNYIGRSGVSFNL